MDLQWLEGAEMPPENLDTLSRSLAFHLKRLVDERDTHFEVGPPFCAFGFLKICDCEFLSTFLSTILAHIRCQKHSSVTRVKLFCGQKSNRIALFTREKTKHGVKKHGSSRSVHYGAWECAD